MEKSITYQRGLLHNFNHIKNYQENKINQYEKRTNSLTEFNSLINDDFNKIHKILYYTLGIYCIFMIIYSLFLTNDFVTVVLNIIINIIIILSTFYSNKIIFRFDKNKQIDYINQYLYIDKSYQDIINNIDNDIKNITSKSDFISDLIDTC
jgi:hypothetical protein